MMKKVRNADGFSFVEVIIALGILSVVSLMIVRFMTTSSVTYSKANADVELQSEAQVVANNIKEKVMSCQHSTHFYDTSHPFTDGGNTYENALLINNEDDQILIYEDNSASSSKLMYIERRRTDGGDATKFDTPFIKANAEVLSEYVDDFHVNMDRFEKDKVIEFTFKYGARNRIYEGEYQVYMRSSDIKIDEDMEYDAKPEEMVEKVIVSPALVTITPNTASSSKIADDHQFTAIVRTTGALDNGHTWAISGTNTGCTIDPNGLLKVTSEPQVDSFKVVATSTQDTTKAGSANVRVKKISDIGVRGVTGIIGEVDGIPAAARKSKVLYTAIVNGWNLTAKDQSVIWKLEYRANYSTGSGYSTLTEFKDGQYVNYNPNIAQISSGGLLTIGKTATNNYEFKITAKATFPDYKRQGESTVRYKEADALLRIKNQEIKFDGGFNRGLEVNILDYFLSGKAAEDGALSNDEMTEIRKFLEAKDSVGQRVEPGSGFEDGKLFVEFGSLKYASKADHKKFFDEFKVHISITDQNDAVQTMTVTYPAVTIAKGAPSDSYIVLRKGSTIDVAFAYTGYNVTSADQIGIYIDDEKVSTDGSSNIDRYLSSYLKTAADGGGSALGTRTQYVNSLKTRLAVNNTDKYYPVGKRTYRIALEDFYQASGKDTRSYIAYDVYVANVEGQNLYIQGPGETGFPSVTTTAKNYTVGPASTTVSMYKQNSKYYMKYALKTYVYDTSYSYWKLD